MDARREDQRHLRGHPADQPDDRRPPHSRLLVEGAFVVPLDLPRLLARVPDSTEFATLGELRAASRALADEFPSLARLETVGASTDGRPIELLTVGHGSRSVLLVAAPHPNEPIGTLTAQFLCRLLCEDPRLRFELDVTIHAIVVADPDGLALNEGWFKGGFSPVRYAREFYRPPHREQVEWSFPIDYQTLRFTTPTAEAATVMRVMERVRPRVFYSLHNAGFCGVYFYVTNARPALFAVFRRLVADLGLTLHRGEPEVPYLRTLAPATYELFGIQDTYDYLLRTLGEDPAPLIEAGTSSDDWLKTICDAYSLVCELPYYTAPALADETPAGCSRRDAVVAGVERAAAIHAETAAGFAALASRAADDRLTRSVADYVAKTPKRLAAERGNAADASYARPATRAELADATVCRAFHHVLYLGELVRVARRAGDAALADRLDARVETLIRDVERESALQVLPIRPLVAMQAGAGLLTVADLLG